MLPVLGLPPALAYGTHDYEVGTASSHGLLEESAQPAHLDFVSGKGFELLPEREQLQLHTLTVTQMLQPDSEAYGRRHQRQLVLLELGRV